MSTIDSMGGLGIQSTYLSQLRASTSQSATIGPAGLEKQNAGAGPQSLMDRLESVAEEAGLDAETLSALREELKTAITQAVEEAEAGETGDDPREAIRSAIDGTLSKYGLDAEELRPEPPAGAERGQAQGPPPPPQGTDAATKAGSSASSTDSMMLSSLLEMMGLVDEEA